MADDTKTPKPARPFPDSTGQPSRKPTTYDPVTGMANPTPAPDDPTQDQTPTRYEDPTKTGRDDRPVQSRTTSPPDEPETETGAAAKLRAFEDEHCGEDATRISGHVEKGIGSPFSRLSDEHKALHAALIRLADAERDHLAAEAKLIEAQAAHEAAEKAVADAETRAVESRDKAKARADAKAARDAKTDEARQRDAARTDAPFRATP